MEPYLAQCVDSILSQDFTDFELILVDDGSPDRCPLICDEYAARDKRVRVLHKENGGLVSARQTGCMVALGEYVICVDSDDWVETGYLSAVEAIVRRYAPDVIAFSYVHEGRKEIVRDPISEGLYRGEALARIDWGCRFLSYELILGLWSKVFKRELYVRRQMQVDPGICMNEDVACVLGCLLDAHSIYISDQVFYHYRITPGSITQSVQPDAFENLKRILAFFDAYIGPNYPDIIKGINRYLLFHIHYIMASSYRLAGYAKAVELTKSEAARELCQRIKQAHEPTKNWRAAIRDFTVRHRLWPFHFMLCRLYIDFLLPFLRKRRAL